MYERLEKEGSPHPDSNSFQTSLIIRKVKAKAEEFSPHPPKGGGGELIQIIHGDVEEIWAVNTTLWNSNCWSCSLCLSINVFNIFIIQSFFEEL